MNCTKINSCEKINIILDKDMLDFQYADFINKICASCSNKSVDTSLISKNINTWPDWMPENPFDKNAKLASLEYYEGNAWHRGSVVTAKAILKDLKSSMITIDNPYGKDWEVITKEMIEFMLEQLGKINE